MLVDVQLLKACISTPGLLGGVYITDHPSQLKEDFLAKDTHHYSAFYQTYLGSQKCSYQLQVIDVSSYP
ncbi:MAG: hypothetical protein JSS62_00995 [Verrucomicrobia bacterium]|nr:hypothetical protein [Verrucomicrobiota bacterium]